MECWTNICQEIQEPLKCIRSNIGPLVTASYLVISTVQIYFIIEVFGITIRCHQNTVHKREIKSEYDGIW